MASDCCPMKIAVLINTDDPDFASPMRDCYTHVFSQVSPAATIDFFDPMGAQEYPSQFDYDLIVVGGGTYIINDAEPRMAKLVSFIRSTVRDYPKQKMVGICLGHQKICEAFGGKMNYMETPELGITEIKMTSRGHEIFSGLSSRGRESFNIHEFHKREVTVPAPGFKLLAENGQVFVSEGNTILTFQGHPEMSESLAKALLMKKSAYTENLDEGHMQALLRKAEKEHHGLDIWKDIVRWVRA